MAEQGATGWRSSQVSQREGQRVSIAQEGVDGQHSYHFTNRFPRTLGGVRWVAAGCTHGAPVYVVGSRVITVQGDVYPQNNDNKAEIVCLNYTTGAVNWHTKLTGTDGQSWVLGVTPTLVICTRTQGTPLQLQNIEALNIADGTSAWTSDDVFYWPGSQTLYYAIDDSGNVYSGWFDTYNHVTKTGTDGSTIWTSTDNTGGYSNFGVCPNKICMPPAGAGPAENGLIQNYYWTVDVGGSELSTRTSAGAMIGSGTSEVFPESEYTLLSAYGKSVISMHYEAIASKQFIDVFGYNNLTGYVTKRVAANSRNTHPSAYGQPILVPAPYGEGNWLGLTDTVTGQSNVMLGNEKMEMLADLGPANLEPGWFLFNIHTDSTGRALFMANGFNVGRMRQIPFFSPKAAALAGVSPSPDWTERDDYNVPILHSAWTRPWCPADGVLLVNANGATICYDEADATVRYHKHNDVTP